MTHPTDRYPAATRRVIGHGLLMLAVGLAAGVGLVFALLQQVELWPLPAIDWLIPGSVRGWSAAHVGGILNGIMVAVLAILILKLDAPNPGRLNACTIFVGWGNTVFYWAGNFAANRGLSAGDTIHGASSIMGAIAYLAGAAAMLVVFYVAVVLIRSAFRD